MDAQPLSLQTPEAQEQAVELYNRVKRALVRYALDWLGTEIAARIKREHPDKIQDIDVAEAVEETIAMKRLANGKGVVACYLDDHPALPAEERALLQLWTDRLQGIFRIDARQGRLMRVHGVIDDLDHQLLMAGDEELERFAPGNYLIAGAWRLGDGWVISGASQLLETEDPRPLLAMAAQLALQAPRHLFRNPERLALARTLQQRQHDEFLRRFGSAWIIGTPDEIIATRRAFFAEVELAPDDPALQLTLRRQLAEALEVQLPERLRQARTLGFISDPGIGATLVAELGLLVETLAAPASAAEPERAALLRAYLESSTVPASLLDALVRRDPASAEQALALALGRPAVSWGEGGQALLRSLRGPAAEEASLPSLVPLPLALREAREHVLEHGLLSGPGGRLASRRATVKAKKTKGKVARTAAPRRA